MSLPRHRPRAGRKLSGVLASLTYLGVHLHYLAALRAADGARRMDRKRDRRPIGHMNSRTSASGKSMISAASGPGRADFRDRDPAVGAAHQLSVHFRAEGGGHAWGSAGGRGDRPDGADPRPRAVYTPLGASVPNTARARTFSRWPGGPSSLRPGRRWRSWVQPIVLRGRCSPAPRGWCSIRPRRASTRGRRATSSKTSSPPRATRRCSLITHRSQGSIASTGGQHGGG